MTTLSDNLAKMVALIFIASSVLLGKYALRTEGHRYLNYEETKSLQGEHEYPVGLTKCREVVKLIKWIWKAAVGEEVQ